MDWGACQNRLKGQEWTLRNCTRSPFEIVEAVKLGADWSHLIEYLNTTHVGERMKLLHCVSQDVEVLVKMLASAPRAVSKYQARMCQTPFQAIAKWRPEVGWG